MTKKTETLSEHETLIEQATPHRDAFARLSDLVALKQAAESMTAGLHEFIQRAAHYVDDSGRLHNRAELTQPGIERSPWMVQGWPYSGQVELCAVSLEGRETIVFSVPVAQARTIAAALVKVADQMDEE